MNLESAQCYKGGVFWSDFCPEPPHWVMSESESENFAQ